MKLYSDEFEYAFSQFLERHGYDEAEHYLFSMVRVAFTAGWRAAGGAPVREERIFQLPGGKQPEDGRPAADKTEHL